MNQIKKIQELSHQELARGIPFSGSWHQEYADTAYVFFGGLKPELSEGDVLVIFSQYGIPVHMKLVRDKETGRSRGFGWLKYEDQRSTVLAVDNLNGAKVLGRVMKVDHAYYEEKEQDEEYEQLLQEELKNDIADDDDGGEVIPVREEPDEEFQDPLLLMNNTGSGERSHRSRRSHRDHRDKEASRSHHRSSRRQGHSHRDRDEADSKDGRHRSGVRSHGSGTTEGGSRSKEGHLSTEKPI